MTKPHSPLSTISRGKDSTFNGNLYQMHEYKVDGTLMDKH